MNETKVYNPVKLHKKGYNNENSFSAKRFNTHFFKKEKMVLLRKKYLCKLHNRTWKYDQRRYKGDITLLPSA